MAWLLLLAGCAKIAPPPGGPPDRRPPNLLSTRPDSMASLPDFEGDVEFQFDEVVSEGGQPNFGLGTGDLEKLVVLSPTRDVPVVKWKRDRITVHPREGWRENTVYRVELLAGVRDLRNNTSRSSTVITFATGNELPSDSLVGRVVDWTNSQPARQSLVEAVLLPDSLVYRTQADSTGRFNFGPLPRGEYLVYGVIDQNRNARRESRENYDSIRVRPGRDSVGELWAFRHDSVPPRVQTATRGDSLTAIVTFAAHLDPYYRLPADSVRVLRLPDSSQVPVEAVLPPQEYDSIYRPRPVRDTTAADTTVRRADTAAARRRPPRDTTPRQIPGVPPRVVGVRPRVDTTERGPLRTKPPLFDKLHVRVREPWRDSTRYVVLLNGVRSLNGITGPARAVLEIVRPTVAADSARDSLRVRPDTVRPDTARRDTTGVYRLKASSTAFDRLRLSSTVFDRQ